MTEREMLRLILVNQAYILACVSDVLRGSGVQESLMAQSQIVLDLVKKDEADEKDAIAADKRICPYCAVEFRVGVGTGRRLDAKFCSDEHQVAFNSRKRSEKENPNG